MSETKFTPGPWGKRAIASALRAAHKHDGSWIDELGDDENMPDEEDASLIHAAPSLYYALDKLFCVVKGEIPGGLSKVVYDALAEARGEA